MAKVSLLPSATDIADTDALALSTQVAGVPASRKLSWSLLVSKMMGPVQAAIGAKMASLTTLGTGGGFVIGWRKGAMFKGHTWFKNDDACTIVNPYLDTINSTAVLAAARAPKHFMTGPREHLFAVGYQASVKTLKGVFAVRRTGQIDNAYFSGLYNEVLGSQETAARQQLMQRKNALGFGQFGLRKAMRAALGGGVVNIVLAGDSLTTNLVALTLRRLFGFRAGFGGMGMLPFAALGLGYDGTSGAMSVDAGNWTFWTYNPSSAPNPPAGFDGWQNWWIKSGAWAKAGNGLSRIYVNAPFNTLPEYAFDTVRVFYYATGSDCAFRLRANGATADAWTAKTAPASTVAAPSLQYVDITGFGAATGRYSLEIEEQIVGAGVLNICGLNFMNLKGGVRFHRQSLGGYKSGDIAGQSAVSKAFFYANIGVDMLHLHLAHNDSGTADATYRANMQTIITDWRAVNANCSLALTQWFSAAALKREQAIKDLAVANDGTVFDVRDIIPSRDWANLRGLLLAPATADDPHLIDDGYEYFGHSLALHLGLYSFYYPLQP